MNKELLEAMEVLEKEKNISKDTMIEAIENSLITACKNNFGKADNVKVVMNRTTGDFAVYAEKTVVEEVEDPVMEISLADARMISAKYQLGDTVQVPLDSKKFGRIATQNAKNVILQKIREEERKALYNDYYTYNYHIPAELNTTLQIDRKHPGHSLQRTGEELIFKTSQGNVLRPLYDLHHQRYVVYWDLIEK